MARGSGAPRAHAALPVRSPKEFQAVIRYERARADRASGRFSLLALQPGALCALYADDRGLSELIQALRRRSRATDVLGWLDERTLSILLPDADLQGTAAFTRHLQKQYGNDGPPLPFTAYCYPDHWLRSGAAADTAEFRRVERAVAGTVAGDLPAWKRLMDITAALGLLLISAPLFLVLAAYIKAVSPGPVFFRQTRLGYRAAPFTFLKFRTMCANNDSGCHEAHLKELIGSDRPMEKLDSGRDPRIIPGGRVLRKMCIDELPQLINVLRGEMSLVGPRPCLPYEAVEYLRWHSQRFDVLPGLTGLWQVSGKNRLTFKQMIRLDIAYCQRISPWLDLAIMLRTVPTIAGLFFEGVANRLRRAAAQPTA